MTGYKTVKNSQLRAALVWFALNGCGFFTALSLSAHISKFDVRGAVTFLGIFLFMGGGALGFIFLRRARIVAGMLKGADVVASFRYPEHLMQKLAKETRVKRLQDNKVKFIFISVIVFIVVLFAVALLVFDESYEVLGPLLLVFLFLELAMYSASKLSPAAAYRRVLRSRGEVIIASGGVLFCGEVHIWKAFLSKLVRVYMEDKKKYPSLIFRYSYYVSLIPPVKNIFEVTIPFFDMNSEMITQKVGARFKNYA